MGAAPTQRPSSSESESDSDGGSSSSSSGSNNKKEEPIRGQKQRTPGAKKPQPKKRESETKQESARSGSSQQSSRDARSEPEASGLLLLGRPPLCCCGSGMETGPKELLQTHPQPQPETQPKHCPPTAEKLAKLKSPKAAKGSGKDGFKKRDPPRHEGGNEDDDDGTASVGGRSDFSVSTAVVAAHKKSASSDASSVKKDLKVFVKSMIGGRDLHLMTSKTGDLRSLGCCFTPEVDALLIADRVPQRILLKDILHVHQGLEALPLELEYKLDANVVVFELNSGNCVAFHLGHPKAAEDMVLYMRLLTAMQRQKARKENANKKSGSADDDDAKSECSVRTANVQQQLTSCNMSSVTTDPHEAKTMYRMFKETMKRGKEFYVLKGDGQLQDVECSLSKGHDVFRMRWEFQTRELPIRDMLSVLTFQQAASLKLGCSLNDLCATIELSSGECITFQFGHVEATERFVFCMRMLVDQKRERFVAPDLARSASGQEVDSARSSVVSSASVDKPMDSKRRGSRAATGAPKSGKSGKALDAQPSAQPSAQAEVETFVRQMMAGTPINVIGTAGPTQIQCSMDPELRAIRLQASDGSGREVELTEVKAVYVGKEAEQLGFQGAATDNLCATLELKSDDCLTFQFPDLQERDRFALCIRIFANALQSKG